MSDSDANSAPTDHAWRRIPNSARAAVDLIHPAPVAVVLAATLGFAVLFAGGSPPPGLAMALMAAMLGGQVAIGVANELVDFDLDALAKPGKPIPSGRVSEAAARRLGWAGLATMTLCGTRFGPAAFALLALGTALGLAYNLWFKRTALSWLPYLLALPLLPIWVRTALLGFDPRLLLLYPLGSGAVVGVHIAQTIPDAASDRAAGLRNPVSRLGAARAAAVACALALTAPTAAVAVAVGAPRLVPWPEPVIAAALAATVLVLAAGLSYAARPDLGARWCFPLIAASVALMGLGWTVGAAG